MAWVPQYYTASSLETAQQALDAGLMKYPGICYLEDTGYLVWITIDNEIRFIRGYNQMDAGDRYDEVIMATDEEVQEAIEDRFKQYL